MAPEVGSAWEPSVMDESFPRPPELDRSTVQELVEWLESMASWVSADHATARSLGREVSGQTLRNLQLYRDSALLFREAYDLPE